MTPVGYFFLFFDNHVIDIIRKQTDLHAAKKPCRANMYGRRYQTLRFALFRSFEITAIQDSNGQRVKAYNYSEYKDSQKI